MNIFKKKLENTVSKEVIYEPIELFQSLFHQEGYSYLRGIQEEVLKNWHDIRGQRDVLCKMNTGSGKTLVSLLMLYSKMKEGVGTSVYLCPDRQLLAQAKKQADLYGIPTCEVDENNDFPNEFLNSQSVLLCTFQKIFNSRSIFERDGINIGALVIDDAHVCADIARTATTVRFPLEHEVSKRILSMYSDDLEYQAPGTFKLLLSGDPYAKILKVPYWSWLSRIKELISLLNEHSDDEELFFKWGLIADNLDSYECFIGSGGIEIAPIHVPFHNVRAYHEAKHRYILSATFEDQIDLIKDLGINKESILNAIIPKDRKDVGQRLILAPQRFDSTITDEEIRELARSYSKSGKNTVVMVPSRDRASVWEELGAIIIDKDTINESVEKLKSETGLFYVLVNRYDGVDLNGEMCRVLILDGYPTFNSYSQLYTEIRLESVKAALKAQIIEQGLGRAVRSGSDHSVVYLMGKKLLQFVGNNANLQYFTPVTRKQLELGLSLLDGEETDNSLVTINETANMCLTQHKDWREYHSKMLSDVEHDAHDEEEVKNLSLAELELEASALFNSKEYEEASKKIQSEIIDNMDISARQKGWYFERAAHYLHKQNVAKANDLQIRSSTISGHMLQPQHSRHYTKLLNNEEQAVQIMNYMKKFNKSQDYKINLEEILTDLTFSPDIPHFKFEHSLAETGRLLGFHAQEPESEFGNGPDVLWGMTDNHYLVLEAKSMATHEEITRDNIGQLLQSGEWFKNLYGNSVKFNLVTLQPPTCKGWNVNPSDDTKVIDKDSLTFLKENLRQFVDGLINNGFTANSKKEINALINMHNFSPTLFRSKYLKNIESKKR